MIRMAIGGVLGYLAFPTVVDTLGLSPTETKPGAGIFSAVKLPAAGILGDRDRQRIIGSVVGVMVARFVL